MKKDVPSSESPPTPRVNTLSPTPIPNGVVSANRMERVSGKMLLCEFRPAWSDFDISACVSKGKEEREGEWEEGEWDDEVECKCEGEGRAAMRIPRESPSKSWWNVIAVTRDAVG